MNRRKNYRHQINLFLVVSLLIVGGSSAILFFRFRQQQVEQDRLLHAIGIAAINPSGNTPSVAFSNEQVLKLQQSGKQNRTAFLLIIAVFILLMFYAAHRFRKAQHKLIQTHTRFKEAQRIARIGSWELDFETKSFSWSKQQYRLFGEKRKTFTPTYESLSHFLSKADQQKAADCMRKAIDEKSTLQFEHDLFRKDGSRITVLQKGTLLFDAQRRPIGMFGTTQDITERKQMDEELRIAKNKFQAIFDNTADGIYQSTPEGRFVLVNRSMATIFGYTSPLEMISTITDIGTQLYANPVERDEMSRRLLSEGHIENCELQVYTRNKAIIWVSVNMRVIRNEHGAIQYFEGTLEDITDRKKQVEEILQLNRELDQFANVTAHDLQEPIRMVSGFLGLLHKKYDHLLDEQGRTFIFRARDGADRMSILIRDLLEFSRSGNKQASTELVDLAVVMDLVDRDLSIIMADTGTQFRIPEELPIVKGTQSALYRLFLNLVSNAIKFQKKDTTPQVTVQALDFQDHWEFVVRDNGIGIAEADQSRLFQAFQRVHRRDVYPGTGLGLVTCKKIVEAHGGKIWITSVAGEGTAVHFTLDKITAFELVA